MERQDLIDLCERAAVPVNRWTDRDSEMAQRQIGEAWALLRAGCDFRINPEMNDRNGMTVWVEIHRPGFATVDWDGPWMKDNFYLPSAKRLDAVNGGDWY